MSNDSYFLYELLRTDDIHLYGNTSRNITALPNIFTFHHKLNLNDTKYAWILK